MNITHAIPEEISGDKLTAIFKRQKELMVKYHEIEKRGGLLQTEDCPVNLDDKRGQARIKDFAWRITEEVGEALDALNVHGDETHFQEELIDGLHFLTELTILSGLNPEDFRTSFLIPNNDDMLVGIFKVANPDIDDEDEEDSMVDVFNMNRKHSQDVLNERVACFIEKLGMTCNCLKNKPWKQSSMITDKYAFKVNLFEAWRAYVSLLSFSMTADEVADIYLRKSQVNKFRQRSNY